MRTAEWKAPFFIYVSVFAIVRSITPLFKKDGVTDSRSFGASTVEAASVGSPQEQSPENGSRHLRTATRRQQEGPGGFLPPAGPGGFLPPVGPYLPPVKEPIELVSKNVEDGTVTVRLNQLMFGHYTKCGPDVSGPDDVAMHLFAVYDKRSMEGPFSSSEHCDFFSNVDACWSTDIRVACGGSTNNENGAEQATIEVIIRDLHHLKRKDRVANPRIQHENGGMCIGPRDEVGNAVSYKATFDCIVEDEPSGNINGQCADTTDCSPSQWCSDKYDWESGNGEYLGKFCKDYAIEGGSCGGFVQPGSESVCAPPASLNDAYLGTMCKDKLSCTGLVDAPGNCEAILGACVTNNDCDSQSYCDTNDGYCYKRLSEGSCCNDNEQCGAGLTCGLLFDNGPFGVAYTCQ